MAENLKVKLTPSNQSYKIKLESTDQSVTLKNTTVNPARLDSLNDVSEPEAALITGSVLVYDADTDTYVLSSVFAKDDDGNIVLQSGSF